jgi:hypothetical protein
MQVEVALPKKKGAASLKGYADAEARWLQRTAAAIAQHVNFDKVRSLCCVAFCCCVIAGEHVERRQGRQSNDFGASASLATQWSSLVQHKLVIICCATLCGKP